MVGGARRKQGRQPALATANAEGFCETSVVVEMLKEPAATATARLSCPNGHPLPFGPIGNGLHVEGTQSHATSGRRQPVGERGAVPARE